MLSLKVFGGLTLNAGDDPIEGRASQRRVLALLALLAAHEKRGISREKLAALLWPEADEEQARNRLKQSVYVLRSELGPGVVVGTTELRLGVAVVSCDLADFERRLALGETESAVAVYAGPFLDGFHLGDNSNEFERWVDDERERLKRCYVDALDALAQTASSRGDHRAALGWSRKLALMDPLDGRHARAIISALIALGDRPGALRYAESHREIVQRELGIDPDAELRLMIDALRAPAVATEPRALGRALGASPPDGPPDVVSPSRVDTNAAAQVSSPARRAGWGITGATIAGILVILAVARLVMGHESTPRVDPQRVAVTAFVRADDNPSTTALRREAAGAIARALTSASVTSPVVLLAPRESDARADARRDGAGLLVSVSATPTDGGVALEAAVVDVATGEERWPSPRFLVGARNETSAVDSLASRVAPAVAVRLDRRFVNWIGVSSEPSSIEAYEEFARGLDRLAASEADASDHFRAAAARDSSFTMPLILASWVSFWGRHYAEADSLVRPLQQRHLAPLDRALVDQAIANLGGSLADTYAKGQVITAVAPHSEWRFFRAYGALGTGRGAESAQILEDMRRDLGWMDGWRQYWVLLGSSLHSQGDYQRELAMMQEARRRLPADRAISQLVLRAHAALGHGAQVEAEVERALSLRHLGPKTVDYQPSVQALYELQAHDQPDAARRVAVVTLGWYEQLPDSERRNVGEMPEFYEAVGRIPEARASYARAVAADSTDYDIRVLFAIFCARHGDLAMARRLAAEVDAMRPADTGDWLVDRAELAATFGDRAGAVALLREAYRAGYWWRHLLHLWAPLRALRGYAPYDSLERPADRSADAYR
jgi:DNA-binding SARP family transcriptional activator